MPSVRFSRDKRGYEYVYLVHTPTRRGKPGRTRVLYWYRTPPGVRIGRKPFDDEVQRTLERQNPGVTFDWETIINTPMPPPDMTEFWRERRRAEKMARQERRAIETETDEAADLGQPLPTEQESAVPVETDVLIESAPVTEPGDVNDGAVAGSVAEPAEAADAEGTGGDATPGSSSRRRRRRRGGRRRRTGTDGTDQALATDAADAPEPADGGETIDSEEQSDEADTTSEEE